MKSKVLMYNGKNGNVLSIWWFVVIALVGLGIVLGSILFYSAYINVKAVESELLANKIQDCFIKNSVSIISEKNFSEFDLMRKCRLNQELFLEGSHYFIKINLSNEDQTYRFGKYSLEKDCEVKSNVLNALRFPGCSTKEMVLDDGKTGIKIIILAASDYDGEVVQNG